MLCAGVPVLAPSPSSIKSCRTSGVRLSVCVLGWGRQRSRRYGQCFVSSSKKVVWGRLLCSAKGGCVGRYKRGRAEKVGCETAARGSLLCSQLKST